MATAAIRVGAQSSKGWAQPLLLGAAGALGVFCSAELGYAFAIKPANVAVVWPPAGLLLALLLRIPARHHLAIVAGAMAGNFLADLRHHLPPAFAAAAAAANAAESLLAAWVVRRFVPGPVRMQTLREVGALVLGAAMLSNAVTSLLGAAVLSTNTAMPFYRAWFVWWTGDGMGMLIVAPALLALPRSWKWRASRRHVVEAALLVALIVGLAEVLTGQSAPTAIPTNPYMLAPLMFWAAIRFGPAASALATLAVTAVTLWHAALGQGTFVSGAHSPAGTVLQLYVFICLVGLSGLVAAVMLAERQNALEQVRLLANAIESSNEQVSVTNKEGQFTFVNRAFTRTFGYEKDEVLGMTPAIVMPPGQAGLISEIAAATRAGGFRGELTARHKDGHELVVSMNTSVIRDRSGEATGVLALASDITDRVRSSLALADVEERMSFALKASHVGVWEVTFPSGVAYWSDICEDLHGLRPGAFGRTYESFLECIHPEDRSQVTAIIEGAIAEQRGEVAVEYRTVSPDGSVHHIMSRGRFLYGKDGAPLRGAGVVTDISDLRNLEEQLRQAQKMEAIGELAGGVAHDFNNLLTAILGYARLLGEDLPSDEADTRRKDLNEIIRAAERAAGLTQQLLAFSRRQVLEPKPLRIGRVVGDVAPMLRRLLGETVDLRAILQDRGVIRADAGQLEQVLVNLAVNARDAMPGGGRLTIETGEAWLDEEYAQNHPGVTAGPHVSMAVSDSGHGMDAATRERVFEPFFTTKAAGAGTGLGLAVVHGIVKQSGGHIWVYSEPGVGTTFKIYFPRTDAEVEVEGPAPLSATRDGSERILLVEDDRAVRSFVARVLTTHGYVVVEQPDPEHAIDFVRRDALGLDGLITDVVLPGRTGPELADELRSRSPGLKVLFMSGYSDGAITHQSLLRPGTRFLQKPFATALLLSTVREMFDERLPNAPGARRETLAGR